MMKIQGRVRGWQQGRCVTPWRSNLVLFSGAGIVAQLLAAAPANWRISGMYIEFANVASPGDTVSPPAYDRGPASGNTYYNNLYLSPDNDYLRVALAAATISSSDETKYPDGNVITFFALTSGLVGVGGKPFGDAYNSLVIGGALVAEVAASDPTQDRILSRFYFSPSEQIPKLANGQIGVEWQLPLS